MRDFPIFTTEFGVSSLILKEIPYRNEAYIHIRDVDEAHFAEHLGECVDFCKMAGAEYVYATGHDRLDAYPHYTTVLEMRGEPRRNPEELANLFPVTEQTVTRWRGIYNEKMRTVDNAGTLERRDEERILSSGGAYFVHRNAELLGIGWLEEGKVLAVASVQRGAGEVVLKTLLSAFPGDRYCLEVASTNKAALRLYEKLGFLPTRELSRWYRVDLPRIIH